MLLRNFLDIEHPQFFETVDGATRYSPLKAYQASSQIYVDLRTRLNADQVDANDMKRMLFFAYSASVRKAAASLEALNTDLMPILQKHPDLFLQTLKTNPQFVASVCYNLGRYFGFENKHQGELPQFLRGYKNRIKNTLEASDAKICLKIMKKNAR